MKTFLSHRTYLVSAVLVAGLLSLLTGCGGSSPKVTTPPSPSVTSFAQQTPPYIDKYTEVNANPPFDAYWQFVNVNYPLPVSYEDTVTGAHDFLLRQETETSIRQWAKADPRTTILSGAAPTLARINIVLEDVVVYNGRNDVIGLTTVVAANRPCFKVEVATKYLRTGGDPTNPADYLTMDPAEIGKILMHELGHTLGLGHSPEPRDLMFYRSNDLQGTSYATYLTSGDAVTLWDTLNLQAIKWYPSRPAVAAAAAQMTVTRRSMGAQEPRGAQVCVYTKE